jgi:outer membrane receptor protein involved in Fe transport
MLRPLLVLVCSLAPVTAATMLSAQQPAAADSARPPTDTVVAAPVHLHEVTVTAAPARREEPASATVVSAAALARVPATNPYDLLRQTAGIEVHEQGQGPGFASDASVRGFSSDHSTDIALWIDGVPNNEPINGHAEGYNDWNVLFPQAIREVDVVKGPTNPFYGNFALAGAVNVRTLERMSGTRGFASGGSHGRLEGTVLSGRDDGETGAVVGLRGVREDGWRPHAGYRMGQAHGRLLRNLSPATTIDGSVELYLTGWDSPGFLTDSQFAARRFDVVANPTDGGLKRRAQERVSLRVVSPSSPLLWRSTVYATQGRWQLFLTTPPEGGLTEGTGGQTEEEDHRYGFGATSALTWSPGKTEITLAGETRFDRSHYENYLTTDRQRDSAQVLVVARQLSAGLVLDARQDLGERLRVSGAVRYDVVGTRATPEGELTASDTRGIASPKLGALYEFPGLGGVYANVSRGFRQTDGVITDPSLPFITAWAYETGLKLDHGAVHGSVAVFRMDVSNEQTFNPLTLTSTSGGASRRQGLELSVEARPLPALELRGDWTFNDAKYRELVTEEGDTLSGTRVFNTAKYVGNVVAALAPPAAIWDLQLTANVVGPYTPFDEPGVELPAYALLHFGAGVRIAGVHTRIGVRNLTNHEYPEVRAGGFVSPGQPRSVYGGVDYTF